METLKIHRVVEKDGEIPEAQGTRAFARKLRTDSLRRSV